MTKKTGTPRRARRAALLAMTAALAAVAGGGATRASAAELPDGVTPAPLTELDGRVLPDGAHWTLRVRDLGERGRVWHVVRWSADGTLSDAPVAVGGAELGGDWSSVGDIQAMADGSVGAVMVDRGTGDAHDDVRLLRFGLDGRVAATTRLPREARNAHDFLLEADGAIAWASICADRLYRWTPGGRLATTRLQRIGCNRDPLREQGTAMAAGADGSIWMVNLCKRRIARLEPDGSLRQWRSRFGVCREFGYVDVWILRAAVVPDPRGGIAYAIPGRASGRILANGRLTENRFFDVPAFFEDDGTLWTENGSRIEPDGAVHRPDVGRWVLKVLPARDGGAWLLANGTHHEGEYKQAYTWYDAAFVRHVSADGAATDWALAPRAEREQDGSRIRGAAIDPDGRLWVTYAAPGVGWRTVRIAPPGLGEPRASQASVVQVAGRSGRTVALQLRCDADVARWCTGSVRAAAAVKPAPFVAAGGRYATVRLTLSPRSARALRRGRAVRTTAVVRSAGAGETRRALTLRP